jgi:hypothetical protein
MAAIPKPDTTSTVAAIYRWYERTTPGGHRAHLGASVIGHACDRYLWLLFRWAGAEGFDGRMLRLFDTGKRAEPRFMAELRGIGCEVHEFDEFGQQIRVADIGGHFGGSLDAAVLGLPEAPKTWHVCEQKTHGQKSFDELVKKKVREAKPMHWTQMQVYMGLTGMERAMYLAENKNTSEVYAERVEFDQVEFTRTLERARRIITSSTPPARLSADPAWFECKWCPFHAQCHGQALPDVNCRTCAHSTPRVDVDGGVWQCELEGVALDDATQRAGCSGHRYIPILLESIAQQTDAKEEVDGNLAVSYTLPNGAGEFVNGYPPGYSSIEIRATQHASMLGDETVQAIKGEFPQARMVA